MNRGSVSWKTSAALLSLAGKLGFIGSFPIAHINTLVQSSVCRIGRQHDYYGLASFLIPTAALSDPSSLSELTLILYVI